MGTTNIFTGNLQCGFGEPRLDVEGLGVIAIPNVDNRSWVSDGVTAFMSIRPEKIKMSKKRLEDFSNVLEGIIETIVYYGRSTQYRVRLKNGMRVHVFQQNEDHFLQEAIDYDDQVFIHWQKNNVVILEK